MLNEIAIDFVGISRGNYEQPALGGIEGSEKAFDENMMPESTRARESYFASYAKSIQPRAKMPLLVTGGFRSVEAMNNTVESGDAALIGLGRPLCVNLNLPNKLLSGDTMSAKKWEHHYLESIRSSSLVRHGWPRRDSVGLVH